MIDSFLQLATRLFPPGVAAVFSCKSMKLMPTVVVGLATLGLLGLVVDVSSTQLIIIVKLYMLLY